MAATELDEIIATHWATLTDAQKVAWQFWSMAHPTTTGTGEKLGLYGWQGFYRINALIGIIDDTALLSDPPSNTAPPSTPRVIAMATRKRVRLFGTTTSRRGFAWLEYSGTLPSNTALIIRQAYDRREKKSRRKARTRHVTTLLPGETGPINMQAPRGYFAETAGVTKFAAVKGLTAARKKHLPFARLITVNMTNGETTDTTIANPY